MRKLISLGLFALFLSVFSSQLLAGGVEACDDMKEELQALGAYGLCNAWHNADEEDKDKFAKKFRDKAGFDVPGSEAEVFECPCWYDLTYQAACISATNASAVTISPVNGVLQFFDYESDLASGFVARTGFCAIFVQDITDPYNPVFIDSFSDSNLDQWESETCMAELIVMSTLHEETDAFCDEL